MFKLRFFLIIFSFIISFGLFGENKQPLRTISTFEADSLEKIPVFYKDRIVPFHTVAHDVTLKLTGKTKIASMNEVQFVASLMLFPSDWTNIPLFKIKNSDLADSLGVKKNDRISISDLFDENSHYKLKNWYGGSNKGFDKAVLDLDEKIEIILLLRTNALFIPITNLQDNSYFPIKDNESISNSMLKLEIFYNKLGVVRWLFIVIFSLTLIYVLFYCFTNNKIILFVIRLMVGGVFLISLWNFIIRWILGHHIPLAGGEQVMMFITMLLLFFSFCYSFTKPWISICTLLMSGFMSLVARLSSNDPIITSLSPALDSPWLAFHVSVIMASYAVFVIMLPISILSEFVNKETQNKMIRPLIKLNYIGVSLLAVGIVLGSLWAKGAWGSYWSWDPKENWAAITLFTYIIPLIFIKKLSLRPRIYNAVLILAFSFVVVTYYGVNYMSSLHSYGN